MSGARGSRSVSCLALVASLALIGAATAEDPAALSPPSEFMRIRDARWRSQALFREMGKVLQHARCSNCHPAGDRPLQGDRARPHEPPVSRGRDGLGLVGMQCAACHQATNFDPAGLPGSPHWKLAPASMAWVGKSLPEICGQLKDPSRNGGRSMVEIAHHMAHDPLVGWAWSPGAGRRAPPGDQATLGSLAEAWVATGAECPSE